MKTCPVCAAKAFDDADVCFGCLHRFEKDGAVPNVKNIPLVSDIPDAAMAQPKLISDDLSPRRGEQSRPVEDVAQSSVQLRQNAPLADDPSRLRTEVSFTPKNLMVSSAPVRGTAELRCPPAIIPALEDEAQRGATDLQGCTVTFDLPGVDCVEQSSAKGRFDIEGMERLQESERQEGQHVLSQTTWSVVVRVAAPLSCEGPRRERVASSLTRSSARCGDARGTHARDSRSEGRLVARTVERSEPNLVHDEA